MYAFDDRVVLLTGASGGIGGAIAMAFAGAGAKLALVGRSDQLDQLPSRLPTDAPEALCLRADLRKEAEIDDVVETTHCHWGRIDILVNCAGVNVRKNLGDYTSEDWDLILDVNLKSVFRLTNRVAEIMKVQAYGKIVNISSIQGVVCWGIPGKFVLGPYCASKAGLISLTKSFALELAGFGINVNAVCPGVVDGKWARELKNDPEIYDEIISKTPLGRLAKNDDITGPTLFLASDASRFVTGQALLVDGGWTII